MSTRFIKPRVCGATISAQLKGNHGSGDGVLARAVAAGSASMEAMEDFLSRIVVSNSEMRPLSFVAETCCGIGADEVNNAGSKRTMRPR